MAVLGLDFRGERLRLSSDIGHTERDTNAPQERVQVAAAAPVPSANDVRRNYAQSWSKASTNDTFGTLNAEFDLSDNLMLYGGVGARKATTTSCVTPFPSATVQGISACSRATSAAMKMCVPPRQACAAGSIPGR